MALRLQIISDQRQELGDRAQIVFGVGGGSIGRAADNDWVLPDPRRYLSARHARILFRDGHYLIEDTSTNGVFANNATAAIGRNSTHTIKDGDTLRFGEYHLRARVDAVEVQTSLSASMVAVDHVTPMRGRVSDILEDSEGIAPSLNLEDLFVSDGAAPLPLAVPAEVPVDDKFQRARAAARARLEGNTPAIFDVRPRRVGLTLRLSFRVRRRTTIGIEGLRHGEVIASTGLVNMRPPRGHLILHLSRESWPTRVRFIDDLPKVHLKALRPILTGTVGIAARISVLPGRHITSARFEYSEHGRDSWIELTTRKRRPWHTTLDTTWVDPGEYDFRVIVTDSRKRVAASPLLVRRLSTTIRAAARPEL